MAGAEATVPAGREGEAEASLALGRSVVADPLRSHQIQFVMKIISG
jgi:hypothetical protein